MKTKILIETNSYKYIRTENQNVSIEVRKAFKPLKIRREVKINWSCFGSVTIKRTEQFIKELQEAVKLAKKEKKSDG